MAQLFYGSINVSELIEQAQKKHTAFVKGNNGKFYANLSFWLNDKPDEYGNLMSIKLSATKDAIHADPEQGKIYVGNAKLSEKQEPQPLSESDTKTFTQFNDDLPF